MPRGYPDDNEQTNPLGQTIADNAELAARLGSVSAIQRSGQVIYATKFMDGLVDWFISTTGVGYVKTRANLGIIAPTCMELFGGVTPADAATATKHLTLIDANKIGVEFYINFLDGTPHPDPDPSLEVQISWHNVLYEFMYTFHPKAGQIGIDYVDSGGGHHTYTINVGYSLLGLYDHPVWHYFKVAVDPSHNNYGRLYIDNLSVNLSSYPPPNDAVTIAPYIMLYFLYNHVANAQPIRLGSMVVTMNEP
jgi:hypothetical protein